MKRSPSCLPLLLVLGLCGLFAGCSEDAVVVVEPSGLSPDDVMLEVRDLGRPPRALLLRRAGAGDIDGHSLLDDAACGGPCRALEVTLFVQNRAADAAAPPVVRISAPPSRAPRPPVALRAQEISEGRIGRIRFLLSLWPEEERVVVRPSASVFIDITGAPSAKETPVDAARNPAHRP